MKKPKFNLPDNPIYVQPNLFLPPGVSESNDFPPIHKDYDGFQAVLDDPSVVEGLGLDLEFNSETGKPSILGIANRKAAAAIPWDAELARACEATVRRLGTKIVGHSVIGADRPVYEGALGVETPLELWDDTIIRHYLCNPDLNKTTGKEEEEGDGGGGAMGFMNLWTMASLYTDIPQWKICRGKACAGPCPLHDAFSYCAIDSWAGLEAKFGMEAEMRSKGIPEKLHWDLSVLTDITTRMEKRGINIDREYVADMEKNFEEHKLEIFPVELVNGKKVYKDFNPKSSQQVTAWFHSRGIVLENTDKKTIRKTLERESKRRGLDFESLGTYPSLAPEIDALYRVFEFKESGKGLKAWFDDRYVDKNGLIHPRFIVVGTSMGRLASSRPNFQNIPARGFGAAVRKAIIPRDPSLQLVKADYSQLEFRKMLHAAGFDPRDLKSDPFVGLVSRSAGQMKPAAEFMHGTERDVAKSLVHAYDYLEGIVVLYGKELDRRRNEIDSGALLVYRDWEFRGGVVGFTGANLAERLFGAKTYENRKAALALQELVTAEFPMIRDLHRKITQEIEERQGVQLETGRFLPLYGSPADDAKMGAAFHGQGGGAEYVQGIMRRYWLEHQQIALLQVHDELVWELPVEWEDKRISEFLWLMGQEAENLPGFVSAFKAKRGANWKEMKDVSLNYD